MPPDVPLELRDLDLSTLVGLPIEQARALVHEHGGQLQTYTRGQALTLDLCPKRVRVLVENDHVVSARGIG